MGTSRSRALRQSAVRSLVFAAGIALVAFTAGCGGGSNSGGSGSGSGSGGSGGTGGGGNTTPTPTITSISPTSVTAGSSAITLTVNGTGFISTSVVQVAGTAETTTYASSTKLTAAVPASQIANGGPLAVTVVNGTVSSSGTATNLQVNNPSPAINSLNPVSEVVGTTSATVVVAGSGFVPSTVIDVNGTARTTTFTSSTQVSVTLTTADLASLTDLSITAVNPTPGGGTSTVASLQIIPPPGTPYIYSVSPTSLYTGSVDTTLVVTGQYFTASSVVEWNGTALATTLVSGCPYCQTEVTATVPAADLATAGSASVTVNTPGVTPPLSNAVTVTITNPPAPTLTYMSPNAGAINTSSQITLEGTGFAPSTEVEVNGIAVPTSYGSPNSITATIPASSVAVPGNVNVTVTTPAPGGGTSTAQVYTAYVAITTRDIVYNPTDGLIYASVPGDSLNVTGNSVVGIDPNTGNVERQIWVGSNPNKLALSTDGTQLFVGLDGASAVAQVDLTQGKVVNQFSLGGGSEYSSPLTALYLAAVPGSPNSVAVATQTSYGGGTGTGITIYDSGIARANSWTSGEGAMSFGSSASTLYVMSGSALEDLTIDSTGVSASTALSTISQSQVTLLQYDGGNLYLSDGQVLNASTGALEGTLYSSASTPASGPIVSDSTLGRAFIGENNFGASNEVLAFDESTYNLLGSITANEGQTAELGGFQKIIRWGQDGIAVNTTAGYGSPGSELFIFQSPLVKDLSSLPADLSVTLTAPKTAATGTAVSYVATVKNLGPNAASGVTASLSLDSSLILGSVTPSQGSCGSGSSFSCDLGSLADGASATVTVSATPTQAGTVAGIASTSSTSVDPKLSNNQATTSTTVTGDGYGALPTISSISPNTVQAGSSDFTLTVNGNGFNESSTVNLGGTALATTFVSAAQLTADVTAAQIANYGWAPVTVTNPSPGGGVSPVSPLTIYDVVNVPASGLIFDPYSQLLYATVPSTSTTVTGNSVVSINPFTGTVGTPVNVGSQPTAIAETTDGDFLYIGLSGADSLARFSLLNHSVTATIPLSMTEYGTTSSVAATSLAVMPGTDNTLAIGTAGSFENLGIFDVTGNTGAFRTSLSSIYYGSNPVFPDASDLYAYNGDFNRYTVNSSGLTQIDSTTLNGMSGFGSGFQFANGLIYGYGGGIANPSTTPPSQIATLPMVPYYDSQISTSGDGVVADPSLRKAFVMEVNSAGTWEDALVRYDLGTYLPESLFLMPASATGDYEQWTMLRWGQDGLAVLSNLQNDVPDQPTNEIILLRGPFVAPQELGTDTAATLTSAPTLTHGSGNTMVTLTGTNFLPGVAVTWNGSYRTTTIVDSAHVTVAIPGSDLASAGSASVVAANPGAPASNTLTVTIN